MPFEFIALAHECAPQIHPSTLQAVISTESSSNPYAIGVVKGRLARQPKNESEAITTAKALDAAGWTFSMGIMQVNRYNLTALNLTYDTVFNPCNNLRAGAQILNNCYNKALVLRNNSQDALRAALSCYYSGNFTTGFKAQPGEKQSYVQRVVGKAEESAKPKTVPIPVIADEKPKESTVAVVPQIIKTPDDLPLVLDAALKAPQKRLIPALYDGFDDKERAVASFDGFSGAAESGTDPYDGYQVD